MRELLGALLVVLRVLELVLERSQELDTRAGEPSATDFLADIRHHKKTLIDKAANGGL